MSLLRRMFSSAFRQARRAEAEGDYRRAAALYAEADSPEAAANALLFHAARCTTLEERLAAYHDALRWLPEDSERRPTVEARIGLAVLDDARERGARTAEERRRLTDAAERLERAGRPSEAATAWELLGRLEDVARCLQAAGDVERLEALLDRTGKQEDRERKLRRLIRDYEMSMAVGARLEARRALMTAAEVAPEDASVADLLRRLLGRMVSGRRVELVVDGRRVDFVGRLPAVLGRSGADVVLRGTSVSRRHCEVDLVDGELVVRDLGSRNGTLVRGVPIGGEMRLAGNTEIGLGDDVAVRVSVAGEALQLEVMSGLDRTLSAVVGKGRLPVPGAGATIAFDEGNPVLAPDPGASVTLGTQSVTTPIVLLVDDRLTVDGCPVEVRG